MDLGKLKVALGRPKEIPLEFNKRYRYLQTGCPYNPNGINFMNEDWDILTILDACRYDVFAEESSLPGNLSKVESRAAGTVEFLRSNLSDTYFGDTVYVTSNPQIYRFKDKFNIEFHHIEHVWKDEWDDDIGTVPPEITASKAKQFAEKYPNKRLLIHFNQPHAPFLGETAKGRVIGPRNKAARNRGLLDHWITWLQTEFTPKEIYWKSYTETLRIVLPHVRELLNEIEGKHVVTADHGEALGARASPIPVKVYEHRVGIHIPELLEVPWLEHTNGTRREIIDDSRSSGDISVENSVVTERLNDLGYM